VTDSDISGLKHPLLWL